MRSLLFILALALSGTAGADPAVRSWALLHSTTDPGVGGDESFRRRGRIQLTVEGGKDAKIELENDPDAMKGFRDQGWYRLKLVPEQGDSSAASAAELHGVETTVPACQLRRANFRCDAVLGNLVCC
jgi:hypothetical protein